MTKSKLPVLIGREQEVALLKEALKKTKAQLIAIYGRRRVGKTFLVHSCCQSSKEALFIEIIGQKKAPLKKQLSNFYEALRRSELWIDFPHEVPKTWNKAFEMLTYLIENYKKPLNLFFDELPWLYTKKSMLVSELEYFWNSKWSRLENLNIILCGSASSWILKKIIHNTEGLHNRLSLILKLNPFTLAETSQFLKAKSIELSPLELVELYMCVGGVPFYLEWVKSKLSVSQNIQNMCFEENGILYKEYESLLEALFDSSKNHRQILSELSKNRQGLDYARIAKETKIGKTGSLSRALKELEASGFIRRFTPFAGAKKQSFYRLIDNYTLFYLKWIAAVKEKSIAIPKDYWIKQFNKQTYKIWTGYSFETVCFQNAQGILDSLKISGMAINASTWRSKDMRSSNGAQVDLVLDRADRIINLCEIKYTQTPFILDNKYDEKLREKQSIFQFETKTKRPIQTILISASGVINRTHTDYITLTAKDFNLEKTMIRILQLSGHMGNLSQVTLIDGFLDMHRPGKQSEKIWL